LIFDLFHFNFFGDLYITLLDFSDLRPFNLFFWTHALAFFIGLLGPEPIFFADLFLVFNDLYEAVEAVDERLFILSLRPRRA
jgi:hypothetical protein